MITSSSIIKGIAALTLGVLLAFTSVASAGLLNIVTTSSADIASGTAGFNASAYGETLKGSIDYAVFDTDIANPFAAAVVGNGRYIYAYQITADAASSSIGSFVVGTSGATVYEITTTADGDVDVVGANFNQAGVGEVAVDPSTGSSDIVAADFDFNNMLVGGQTSYILLFSSDREYITTSIGTGAGGSDEYGSRASINGVMLNSNPGFMTTVPEPTTLAIIGLGGLVAARRRKTA